MTKVLGQPERNLTFTIQLGHNGYSVSISALGNTGANGLVFIDTDLDTPLGKSLGVRTICISKQCPVQGFDGRPGAPITHAILMTLMVDCRQQRKMPMFIADLGRPDLILRRMWFKRHGVPSDCENRRLIWPGEPSLAEELVTKMTTVVPREILRRQTTRPEHQEDADRRDRLINMRERCQLRRTYRQDHRDTRAEMRRALSIPDLSLTNFLQKPRGRKPDILHSRSIDIAFIGAASFHRHLKQGTSEVFFISLYEIDRVLED